MHFFYLVILHSRVHGSIKEPCDNVTMGNNSFDRLVFLLPPNTKTKTLKTSSLNWRLQTEVKKKSVYTSGDDISQHSLQ